MASTTYSHRIRVLACASCGAPVDAAIEGGTFRCAYCGSINQLDRRDESDDLARAMDGAAATVSESERHARLRDQARQGESFPAGVEAFVSEGTLDAARVDGAKAEWLRTRAALTAARSFPLSERFFYLTILLVQHVDERTRRALLESAVELLPDEGHRHILRCVLARSAARAGDLAAADDWLTPCNPRPLDLPMDTAYRYAAATLATARRDHARVLALLGMTAGDVPLAERDELGCTLLRIDALENTHGREADAITALRDLRQRIDSAVIARAIAEHAPLSVCGRSWFVIERAEARQAVAELEGALAKAQERWFSTTRAKGMAIALLVFSCLFTAGGFVLIEAGIVGRGAHEQYWCPRLCDGCRAPMRVAAWDVTVNFERPEHHQVRYCSDSEGRLDAIRDAQLWEIASGSEAQTFEVRRYEVTNTTHVATMLASAFAGTLPLTLACTVMIMFLGYHARRGRRLELAERLGHARQRLEVVLDQGGPISPT